MSIYELLQLVLNSKPEEMSMREFLDLRVNIDFEQKILMPNAGNITVKYPEPNTSQTETFLQLDLFEVS